MPEPPPLEVAVAVIRRDGRLLISQRMPEDSFGGFWEFPGGKRARGETMEAALMREIREELGVAIEVGPKRMTISHRYPGRVLQLHCYDCRWVEGEPQALECAGWRWIAPEELDRFTFPPASEPLIRQLRGADVR